MAKLFGKPYKDVVQHPGAFSAAARSHGMPTDQYAEFVLRDPNSSEHLKRQARLAKTFKKMREGK